MRLTEKELPKEKSLGKVKDLTKQKFGKLTPLYRCESNSKGIYWVCKCECGYYTKVRSDHLTNGNVISCGDGNCKAEDLTGQKFNKLTPLYRVENKGKKVVWHCKCDCGNEVDVMANHLKDNHTTSCGCSLSLGEEKICKILLANNIEFKSQKVFEDCIFNDSKAKAKFDFYLIKYNTIIEFDGIQHFYYQENSKIFTKEKFEKILEHDKIKNQYCKDNNILLIRIPYTHYDNLCIEDLLPDTTSFLI